MANESVKMNDTINLSDNSYEIDVFELLYLIRHHIIVLLIAFIVGGVIGSAYSYSTLSPDYKATAKMYLTSTDSIINISDLSLGNTLAADYQQLIVSRPMLESVVEQLGVSGLSYQALRGMISLSVPANTHILEITVTSKDPTIPVNAANEIAKYAVVWIPTVMSISNAPNIMEEAVETVTVYPNYFKYTLFGAFGLTLIVYAIFVIKYLLNDTVRSADDLEKFFNITPLTSIPEAKNIQFVNLSNNAITAGNERRGQK